MTTTVTAERNVSRTLREQRRELVQQEQARLDTIAEGKRNARRAEQIAVERAQRVAEAVKAGSVVEFTVNDDTTMYRIRVLLGSAEPIARAFGRAATIALTHLIVALAGEKLEAARVNGPGPDTARRLAIVLDGDACRHAQAHGVLIAEQKKAA